MAALKALVLNGSLKKTGDEESNTEALTNEVLKLLEKEGYLQKR